MDLTQSKLTKAEWTSVEVPVPDKEKEILQLLQDGFHNVHVRRNDTPTLATVSKIEMTPQMQDHLYAQYLEPLIADLVQQRQTLLLRWRPTSSSSGGSNNKLKTKDLIRMKSMDGKIDEHRAHIYEFVVLDFCKQALLAKASSREATFFVYTLMELQKAHIPTAHPVVTEFVQCVLDAVPVTPQHVVRHAYECIEQNPYLFKYADKTLFEHQKQLFRLFSTDAHPKLVLYTAPTGTGKTLSPLGLCEGYRVIFICAARHVGLALAKSAITMQKRVAVAFGCETASDIRLHYFAASEYTRNKRTGGIGKVDNAVGDKVELMICDVKSYLVAMHYMLAFSPDDEEEKEDQPSETRDADLVTYWDEPTITMDYAEHPLHAQIQRNWQENKISKLVLSCATLPNANEVGHVIQDFKCKFPQAAHHTIQSFESSKSISLWNKSGQAVLPHTLFHDNPDKLGLSTEHCLQHKELMRYMDLREIVRFIDSTALDKDDAALHVDSYFKHVRDVTMHSIKEYYLVLLQRKASSSETSAAASSATLLTRQHSVFQHVAAAATVTDGILLTTRDAHTLTDGPTIFLAEDVEKVGRFLIQQSNIPMHVFQHVTEKIAQNSSIQRRMDELQKLMEDKEMAESNREQNADAPKGGGGGGGGGGLVKKSSKSRDSSDMTRLLEQMEHMRSQIRNVCLDNVYIPNTVPHQRVWNANHPQQSDAFVPSVDAESVREIMALDVPDHMKLLLLLGIGMFGSLNLAKYVEIMKRLATEQRLFVILASSDYIYGTNYQFCHGFLGKDLTHMTYQKTIQAMGRIGRTHIQQTYTIRFRDDAMVTQLFLPPSTPNMEAEQMNRLFSM
jgi:hypothetical protein